MARMISGGAALLVALAGLASSPSSALAQSGEQAGVSAAVRGEVLLARATDAVGRQVESGEAIFLGDAIRSSASAGMQILLLDETVFTIGPNSEISIDTFVYDPATGAGQLTANMTRGVMRFVTGKVAAGNPQNMTINLPVGSIGIRGTMGVVSVFDGPSFQALSSPAQQSILQALPLVQTLPGPNGSPVLGNQIIGVATLNGPGENNNSDLSVGSFTVTAPDGTNQTLISDGFGVALDGNTVSEPFVVPTELSTLDLGQVSPPPAPASAPNSGSTLNAPATQQANVETGQVLASVLQTIGNQAPALDAADSSVAVTQTASLAAGNAFTFEGLAQITSGSYSASSSLSSGALSYSFNASVSFSNREISYLHFSAINDGVITTGQMQTGPLAFSSLSGPATISSFDPQGTDCAGGACQASVTFTSPLDLNFSLSTTTAPTPLGGSVTLH